MKRKTIAGICLICTLLLSSCGSVNENIGTPAETLSGITETVKPKKKKSEEWKQYEITQVGEFRGGIAQFMTKSADYGYIDINGNIIVEPENYGQLYWDGAALVAKSCYSSNYSGIVGASKGFIVNKEGDILVSTEDKNVENIGMVSCGLYFVKTVEELISGNIYTITYYDTEGKEQFSFNDVSGAFEENENFNKNGYAIAYINGKGHIINVFGDILEFDFSNFHNKYSSEYVYFDSIRDDGITVKINKGGNSGGYYGYVDFANMKVYAQKEYMPNYRKTEKLIESIPEFSGARSYSYELSADGKYITVKITNNNGTVFYSVIDSNGNILMQPTTSIKSMGTCRDGLIYAQDKNTELWGYIDVNGNWIITPQYSKAKSFSEGYATVENNIVINKKGEVIFDFNNRGED